MKNFRFIIKQAIIVFLITFFAGAPLVQARGYEDYSVEQLEKMGIFFTKGDFSCGAGVAVDSTGAAAGGATGALSLTATQIANAKIIIGIAKTYKLGEKGALIGVMTSITESHLRAYASDGIPVSKQNPAWINLPAGDKKSGHDHDSVGMFQQRVSTGWSTFGNGTSKDIVWQLMDPAYGAQAFFGTPPGAKLPAGLKQPTALTKGLQNVKNWQSRDPWIDSQEVQVSFDSTGNNYKKNMPEAQKIIDTYYKDAPALPLPISVNGSAAGSTTAGGTDTNGCPSSSELSGTGVQKMMTTIAAFAWPDYCAAHTSGCKNRAKPCDRNAQSYCGTSNEMRKAYVDATKTAKAKGDYFGDCSGVDCGGFVTRVMHSSGADPEYNKYKGNTAQQMAYLENYSDGPEHNHAENRSNPIRYHRVSNSEKLISGDIAVQNNDQIGHTFIYVGKITGLDNNGKPTPFNGVVASASQCGRAPMASSLPDRNDYEWFRLLK